MLRVENLSKSFGGFSMREISFEVQEGELFVILGPSGVGKTVLLESVAGLLRPDSGKIFLDEREVTHEKIQSRKIGIVYQDQALFPHMNVWSNIAYGLSGLSSVEKDRKVKKLSEMVGVGHLLLRKPPTLSGGEAQRVALARTLAVEPRCILLDEPISSLDVGSRREMRKLIRKLNRNGHTMLYVTHDFDEAVSLASRIAVMEKGCIVQIDLPDQVFRHPKSEFVAGFIGIRNYFRGRLICETGKTPAFRLSCGKSIRVETCEKDCDGFLLIPSTDVLISEQKIDSSALNSFQGVVEDIAHSRTGVEVTVNAGFEIAAHITGESLEKLSLSCGKKVYLSFKASSTKFFPI